MLNCRLIVSALCLGLLLAIAPAVRSQGKKDPEKTDTKKVEKKTSPELDKARAEEKRLKEEMKSLAEKLHKTHAEIAKLGGGSEKGLHKHHKGLHGKQGHHKGPRGGMHGHRGKHGHHGHRGKHGHHGHRGKHGHHGHHGMHGHHGPHGKQGAMKGPWGGFDKLKLTDEQKKKAGELKKKMSAEFESILTPEQKKIFEGLKKNFKEQGTPGTEKKKSNSKSDEKKTKSGQTSLERPNAIRHEMLFNAQDRREGRNVAFLRHSRTFE